jgi:hypothetical protein
MIRCVLALLLAGAPAPAATYWLTVAGLGGEPDYEVRFAGLATDVEKALAGQATVRTLAGAQATKANIQQALAAMAKQAKGDDALVLMLIGHGTYDGAAYKFNIPGSDVTAEELAAWLEPVEARQLVVNTTSASGGGLQALQRAGRTVITATKSGTEKNATVFARFFAEALRDNAADTDKNESVTALEGFRYAVQKTERYYTSAQRIATEHALLEDTGAGEGVRAPGPENGRGVAAARLALVRFGASQAAARSPEKMKLLARKEEIESQIDQLKYDKAALPVEEYRRRLQTLLIELARVQLSLDQP